MGGPAMQLEKEQLEQIGEYVKSQLPKWIRQTDILPEKKASSAEPNSKERTIDLTERIIRVEEELKNQRDLMKQGFDMMDKRFTDLQHQMDKRFEQVDKRFTTLQWFMGIGITLLMGLITLFQYV